MSFFVPFKISGSLRRNNHLLVDDTPESPGINAGADSESRLKPAKNGWIIAAFRLLLLSAGGLIPRLNFIFLYK
ncbi:hypothetical protein [Desulfonema magnum]|uniref:Uncharacterized protein n=1 Tax=Desulfonema magnum TaxID=45655 RepID=A0A975BSV7_9BACT|nr:hypothetical protein [Desulfonema magnum]QTA90445.1 Uncharacterized protein dnm_065060 [Desulfonema magnum]